MGRVILHADLNCYYAGVEMMLNPELRKVPMAVGGSVENRHGIILTKNQLAKNAGVKTGMALWEARQLCDGLIIVPPRMEMYLMYSERVREIYRRYTFKIEPFGIDESWLDCTGSLHAYGGGAQIAESIRETVKRELGLTVSVGVSWNKIFAKFGSDYKKPDAQTEITCENYKDIVWPCPVDDLFFVGRATRRKLECKNIHTIGELAQLQPDLVTSWFGKNGRMIWSFANGYDTSPVAPYEGIKSIGRGITAKEDLLSFEEVKQVIYDRSLKVSRSLRKKGLAARRLQLSVRDINLWSREFQCKFPYTTQSWHDIAEQAMRLFNMKYGWSYPLRSLTVRAIDLVPAANPLQISLFNDYTKIEKNEKLEKAIEGIKDRYGEHAVVPAITMNSKVPRNCPTELMQMPAMSNR